jgi:hypothetical protein
MKEKEGKWKMMRKVEKEVTKKMKTKRKKRKSSLFQKKRTERAKM